jgi:chaperonin cofactor prefoldin
MRSGRVIDWATALETSPEELHRRLQTLWREQEDLYARQARIRAQLHTLTATWTGT